MAEEQDRELAKESVLSQQQQDVTSTTQHARQHAHEHGMEEYADLLVRGFLLANHGADAVQLSEDERRILLEEKTRRFKQT